MPNTFSSALYYPTIDIGNINWLKTAMLFWDSISTIVPNSMKQPYNRPETQYLADVGFLRPLFVTSEDKSVVGIENDILALLYSSEFSRLIKKGQAEFRTSKKSQDVENNFEFNIVNRIYDEKMSYYLRNKLKEFSRHLGEQNVYCLGREFSNIYMITLASKLCEDHELGMITDSVQYFDIGNIAKVGDYTATEFTNHYTHGHQMEQGLLLNSIIEGLSISPETDFSDIISFKNHHRDELGRLKVQIAKLTQNLSEDKPLEAVRQEIGNIYNNEFLPAFNDFKSALKGSRIKWLTDTFFKVSVITTSLTNIFDMSGPRAVFADLGVSIAASAVTYNAKKKQYLRKNPYSYLLSIKNEYTM